MTDRRTVWIILLLATALRLIIAARIPLVDDEAYYWTWSQRLAWGYPDHPPAIAAVIRATTSVLGRSALAVRTGPILLHLGIAWLLYDLGRRMFGAETGALAALWYQTVPLFSIGGMLSFPDAPFIFFWMLTMWALWRAARETAWGWWVLVGTGVGLAALSKLAALFLGIAVAGYLLWGERGRRWWRRPEIYGAAVLALALMVPMLQWNAAHGGIMVAKARDPYAWVSTGIPALNALAYAGAHLLYYGPLAAVLLLLALAGAWRGPRATDPRYVLVLWMAVPILVVFGAMSFDGTAKPHWTAPAYLTMLLPAAALWTTLRSVRLWRALVTAAVAVNLVLVGGLVTVAFWPGSPAAREQRAWPEFAVELQRLVEATPASPGRFILVPDYQTAAQIEYHLGGTLVTTPFGFDAYEVWISRQRLIDWNAIYLTADDPAPGIPIERMFRQVEQLPPLSFALRGQIFRTYTVYRGLGYRGFPRPVARPL